MNKVNSIEVHFALGKQTYQVDIIRVRQEYCRADKKHEELSRWYHSLHFILDGCGTISVNGKNSYCQRVRHFYCLPAKNMITIPTLSDLGHTFGWISTKVKM